jgi:hypothetical protein
MDLTQSVSSADERYYHAVNPGLSSVFPWLHAVASSFEKYTFHKLKFHYITSLPTSIRGMVALIPDYDAADSNTTLGKGDLLGFADAARGPCWANVTLTCDKKSLGPVRFTREGFSFGGDIKTYDQLQLIVMHNAATTGVVGELWVEYDVELFIPQHEGTGAEAMQCAFTPTAYNKPFAAPNEVGNNCGVAVKDDNTLQFKEAGKYLVSLLGTGTGLGNVQLPTTNYATAEDKLTVKGDFTNATSTEWMTEWLVNVAPEERVEPFEINWQGLSAGTVNAHTALITELPGFATV